MGRPRGTDAPGLLKAHSRYQVMLPRGYIAITHKDTRTVLYRKQTIGAPCY